MKFNKFIIGVVLLSFFSSCVKRDNITIESFTSQNDLEKSNEGTKSIYYLVNGYTEKESDYLAIERHVCGVNRDSLDDIYTQFWISYYRMSDKSNNINIKNNPKDFFRYTTMEDRIAEYSFIADSIVARRKFYLQEYAKESTHLKEYQLCAD